MNSKMYKEFEKGEEKEMSQCTEIHRGERLALFKTLTFRGSVYSSLT